MSMKNSSDTIGNRTRAVSQTTAPPRASLCFDKVLILLEPDGSLDHSSKPSYFIDFVCGLAFKDKKELKK
jgi:hypothetical protein